MSATDVILTDRAARRIAQIAAGEDSNKLFRVSVEGGGCSGFQYKFDMVGSTNIFDTLERAFADQDVDTIYLLTDGDPSAGRIKDVEGIAEEVRRWNRTRQIVIHCIGIGTDSPLLKRLAAENGGSYKFVR